MKIIVTGVAGFIGFYLASRLLKEGCAVVGIDSLNSYYDVAIKHKRLGLLQNRKNFRFVCAGIADLEGLRAGIGEDKDACLIVHLAAQAGVRYSIENPQSYVEANVLGQVNLFEMVAHWPNKPAIVYASSSSVYGRNEKIPFAEADRTDSPASLYAATKKAGELIAHSYAHIYGIRAVGLRFFTVYGPYGRPDMAPWIFTRAILAGEPIKIFNHGDMRRDFTYIDDIIDGIMGVVKRLGKKNAILKPIYNLGNNEPVLLMDFIGAIEKAAGQKAVKEFYPMQAGDVPVTYADIDAAAHDFGFKPKVTIDEGMAEFVGWFRREGLT